MALTADPAGTVATRFAGVADFRATLWWDEAPSRVPGCLPLPGASFKQDLGQSASPCGTRVEVRGTVRALTKEDLGGALDLTMRAVGEAAAVSGAVLEMRALMRAAPRAADPWLAQRLAMDLREAGFGVRFAPCWEPVDQGAVAVGTGEGDPELLGFLGRHDLWRASW